MVFAAEVGHLAGYLSADDVALHKQLLTEVGLPVAYPRSAWPELRATMSLDKKTRGARLRMVILDGIGNPIIYDNPPEELLAQAYQAMAARDGTAAGCWCSTAPTSAAWASASPPSTAPPPMPI